MSEKASGLRQPSKIGRPCCALPPKPAVPPTPSRPSSMNSMEPIYENPRKISTSGQRRGSDISVVLTEDTDSFIIGDRVWVGGSKPGSIAYIGETQFAPGDWAGVVLDEPIGKNDGSVAGCRYFQCAPKHGIFSRLTRLTRHALPNVSLWSPDGKGVLSPEPRLNKSLTPSLNTSTTSLSSVSHRDLKLGDRVIVSSSQGSKTGVLRYIGDTEFAAGEWCGVELDDPIGKNDGSVADKRYFECRPKYGLFAPLHKVTRSPSSKRPSLCVVHKPTGASLNTSLRRTGSKESVASMTSLASTTASTKATTTRRTSLRTTSTPVRASLQEMLKEKQQEVDMLKKERELERERMTKAATQADNAEQAILVLQKEYDKYRESMEKTVLEAQSAMEKLLEEKSQLTSQLDEEKQKNEDLLFRFDEESVNKEDIQKETSEKSVINTLNEKKIKELEDQLAAEHERVIQLERENTKLFEVEEELAKERSDKSEFSELKNRNSWLEEMKIKLEKQVFERNDVLELCKTQIKDLEAQLKVYEDKTINQESTTLSLQQNYDVTKSNLEEKCAILDKITAEYAENSETIRKEIEMLKEKIKESEKEKESAAIEYQKLILEKNNAIELRTKELVEATNKFIEAQKSLNELKQENTQNIDELSTEFKNKLTERDGKIEGLTEKLGTTSLELEKITAELSSQKTLSESQNKLLEEARKQLDSLMEKFHAAEQLNENLRGQIESLRAQGENESKIISEGKQLMEESLATLQASCASYSIQISKLNDDLKSKDTELLELKKSKDAEIEELIKKYTNQMDENSRCIANINNELSDKLIRLMNLEQEVADLKALLATKDEEIKTLVEKISSFNDAITFFEQTKTNLESEVRMHEVTIAELNKKILHSDEKINQLTEQKVKLEQEIASVISTSADSSEQLIEYNKDLRAKEKLLDEFREKVFKLENELTSSVANLNRTQEELTTTNQLVDQLRLESGDFKDQLDATTKSNETKVKMLEDLSTKLSSATGTVSNLTEKCQLLSSASEENKTMKNVITELQEKLLASGDEVKRLRDAEEKLLSEQQASKESIEALEQTLEREKQAKTQLEANLARATGEIGAKEAQLHADSARFSTQVEEASKEKVQLEEKIQTVTRECETAQNDVQAKQKIIEELVNMIETLKTAGEQSSKDTETTEAKLKTKEMAIEKIEKEKQSLVDDLMSLKIETTSKDNIITDLNKQLAAIKKEKDQLESLKLDISSKDSVMSNLHSEMEALKLEKETVETEMNKKDQELELKLQEIGNMTIQNSNLKAANDSYKKLLKEFDEKVELMSNDMKTKDIEAVKSREIILDELNNAKKKLEQSRENENRLEKENKQVTIKFHEAIEELKTLTDNNKNHKEINSNNPMIVTSDIKKSESEKFEEFMDDKNLYQSQIDFLNSVIVDMQQKNEKLLCKIEVLEMGVPAIEADDYSRSTLDKKAAAPRLFCDICDQFDLHDTEDCPKQSQEFELDNPPQKPKKPPVERAYCENCEMFGHDTANCDDAETF